MKKIKVEDESLQEHIKGTIDTLHAIRLAIVDLAKQAREREKGLWVTIRKEFPETDGYTCSYDYKRDTILILGEEGAE